MQGLGAAYLLMELPSRCMLRCRAIVLLWYFHHGDLVQALTEKHSGLEWAGLAAWAGWSPLPGLPFELAWAA